MSRSRIGDMNDGGMGSLLVVTTKPERSYGRTLSVGWFNDEDGFPVLLAINLDKEDEIFELDSWKVDFSPRRRFLTLLRRWFLIRLSLVVGSAHDCRGRCPSARVAPV